jgi:hypothetical protein
MAEVHGNRTTAKNTANLAAADQSGAKSGAVGAREVPDDAGLRTVIDAWPTLPEQANAEILTIVAR